VKLTWKNFEFDFTTRTFIMGILNVTPDSFSDGGKYFHRRTAVERALQIQDDGADLIDIGGESTRPGAEKVSAQEEIRRVIPVIEELAGTLRIPISIDTYKSGVAHAALSAGASLINDISGLRFDPEMAAVAADYRVPVVLMHIRGTPGNMQSNPSYTSLIHDITEYLRESISIARRTGIQENMMMIDPGIGFGKTVEHNLEIIQRLDEFSGLEKPILLGPSRKSFIGTILGERTVDRRLEGTAAAVAIGIAYGANIVRVHDVKEMLKVARIADSIKRGHA
jgi:dihydropteroate synthase